MTYAIRSGENVVEIESLGAQLKSIFIDSQEFLWQGDEKHWPRRAPNLFPHCGVLNNNEFEFEGKKYSSSRHGFAREMEHSVAYQTENEICFSLKYDQKTLLKYPFKFELLTIYKLEGKKLTYNVVVRNVDQRNIYFSFGTHAGINIDGASKYVLKFEKDEPKAVQVVCGADGLLTKNKIEHNFKDGIVPMDSAAFSKTMLLQNIQSEYIDIINKEKSKTVRFNFAKKTAIVLWSNEGEQVFLCVEPWDGLPDKAGHIVDITKKAGIEVLEQGKEYNYNMTIEII